MITAPDMATAPLDIAERTHLGRSYVFVANSPYPQLRDDPDCLDDFAGVMFVHGGLPVIPPAPKFVRSKIHFQDRSASAREDPSRLST